MKNSSKRVQKLMIARKELTTNSHVSDFLLMFKYLFCSILIQNFNKTRFAAHKVEKKITFKRIELGLEIA